MDRRKFLQLTGLFGTSAIIGIGTHGWAAKAIDMDNLIAASTTGKPKRLIVVFLRGAADGLNIVIPHGENAYYDARPTLAIAPPGDKSGALNLDGRFGLHPALAPVMPLWQQRSLAFIHASGSPNPSRSHFDAQDYMESGTPGVKTTSDGWMNRLLAVLPSRNPVQGLNVGETTPAIFKGRMPVASLPTGRKVDRPMALDRPQTSAAFDRLYSNSDSISKAYQEGRIAREQLVANLQQEMIAANNGAPPPNGFARDARKLARLIVRDPQIQLAFLALGKWDTHINQGGVTGQLAGNLKSLGEGLSVLAKELGSVYSDTAIIVMSEFGRTVRENGNKGTDHGHGNVMWVLGGGIKGGKVYGDWPGLSPSQLYEGRDLAVTTDFRDVVSTVLTGHLKLDSAKISQVFPGYSPKTKFQFV